MCASCSAISCWASRTSTTTLRVLDRLQRLDHRELLDRLEHLAAAAQPGGVDQRVGASAALEVEVDRVARRARLVEGDHPLLAEQRVDQRRLADVGPPDDRHLDARGTVAGRRALPRAAGAGAGTQASACSNMSRTPSPCAAEIASGAPSPSSWKSATARSAGRPSALLATSTTGRPDLRSMVAMSRSDLVQPGAARRR